MSTEPANPFAGDQSTAQRKETLVRWLLRLSTVLIVTVTVSIVAHIFIKGAPITFRKEFPFVNVKFLTELPGTLHVIFDKQGNTIETDVNGADAIKKQLGDNFREEKTISYSGGGNSGADRRHSFACGGKCHRGALPRCMQCHLLE
jgi:phosphate transport system permease protein